MMFTPDAVSGPKRAALARPPYQSVQAGARCSGGTLLGAVRPEASAEHIGNAAGRPGHSCGFRLAAALKNL